MRNWDAAALLRRRVVHSDEAVFPHAPSDLSCGCRRWADRRALERLAAGALAWVLDLGRDGSLWNDERRSVRGSHLRVRHL